VAEENSFKLTKGCPEEVACHAAGRLLREQLKADGFQLNGTCVVLNHAKDGAAIMLYIQNKSDWYKLPFEYKGYEVHRMVTNFEGYVIKEK
jgi:hypothetical protein